MPIFNNVPRKNGREIKGSPFRRESSLVGVTTAAAPGKTYASPFTASAVHPQGMQFNVSTQRSIAASTQYGQTGSSSAAHTPEVQPHEHGTFFGKRVIPPVKSVSGASPTTPLQSDTAFHPQPAQNRATRPVRTPARIGERTNAPSFFSGSRLLSDPQFQPHGGSGRWTTTKRGAAG